MEIVESLKKLRKMQRMLRRVYGKSRVARAGEHLLRASRDSFVSRKIAHDLGYKSLNRRDRLFSRPASENTLFVLATGSSVNLLDDTSYERIRLNHSIGINRWLMSEFVPDAISLDSTALANVTSPTVRQKMEYLGARFETMADRSPELKVLLLRPPAPSSPSQFYPIPRSLIPTTFVYGRMNLYGVSEQELLGEVRMFLQSPIESLTPSNVLIDNGSSVVRMVSLGISQGYDRIVLVGVDADERPYFYNATDKLANNFEPGEAKIHSTEDTKNRPHKTSSFIRALGAFLNETAGPRLFVASSDSKLSDTLPVFDWAVRN